MSKEFGTTLALKKSALDASSFRNLLKDADAVIDASMKLPIGRDELLSAPHLRIISTATTGSDHIDGELCIAHDITVKTLREDKEFLLKITPAAEHTWALLLSLIRNLPGAVAHVQEGGWNREKFPSLLLDGKMIGIVGCGRLGTKVARFAVAFNMKVIGYDPMISEWPPFITPTSLETIFKQADVISMHVHLNEDTRGLASASLLSQIKPGAFLINTSRGGVLDENALLEGLRSGRIGGAALDVLSEEPEVAESPMVQFSRDHPNLIITPHSAGYSPEAVNQVCIRAASKVVDFFGGASSND